MTRKQENRAILILANRAKPRNLSELEFVARYLMENPYSDFNESKDWGW